MDHPLDTNRQPLAKGKHIVAAANWTREGAEHFKSSPPLPTASVSIKAGTEGKILDVRKTAKGFDIRVVWYGLSFPGGAVQTTHKHTDSIQVLTPQQQKPAQHRAEIIRIAAQHLRPGQEPLAKDQKAQPERVPLTEEEQAIWYWAIPHGRKNAPKPELIEAATFKIAGLVKYLIEKSNGQDQWRNDLAIVAAAIRDTQTKKSYPDEIMTRYIEAFKKVENTTPNQYANTIKYVTTSEVHQSFSKTASMSYKP